MGESTDQKTPTAVGLFAGIGGIELGLERAGFGSSLLCEVDPAARAVLEDRFDGVERADDIRQLAELPQSTLVAAGFPCQDLSQAGRTKGITGSQSSLIEHVFRLLDTASPDWLLLENVSFMLRLDRGGAMTYLVEELTRREFRWAYRIVDSRAFGLPQRRQRVVLLASRELDPRPVLFGEDAGEPDDPDSAGKACGFYWTEGLRGLGWAVDAIPTLKGGSAIGIPSPPAILMPDGRIVTPEIRDAERLQGFDADWTEAAAGLKRGTGQRWRLVGNAVSVPMAEWAGNRILHSSDQFDPDDSAELEAGATWPTAAWGEGGRSYRAERSMWPRRDQRPALAEFLEYEPAPLSLRATSGFRERTRRSSLRWPPGFIAALDLHLERMKSSKAA